MKDHEKLELLAKWIDKMYPNDPFPEVQKDLQRMAFNMENGDIAANGELVWDSIMDVAHNSCDDRFIDWTEEDWDKIAIWEKYLKQCLDTLIADIKYDAENSKGDFNVL